MFASHTILNQSIIAQIILRLFCLYHLGVITIEFSRLPSMFGLIRKFRREAVLTDKDWIKKVSEFEGMLIPGLEIKAFNREQRDGSETWLSK